MRKAKVEIMLMKGVLLFSMFTLTVSAFGQDDISVYGERRKEFDERNKILDSWVRNSENQRDTYKSGLPANNKLSKADIIKLTPPKEDLEKYAQFLKNRKTGIVKLLNLSDCDNRIVAINDTRCLEAPQIIGNGSIYSFSARSYLGSFDIRLSGENLSAGLTGLMTDLGDLSLADFDFKQDTKALKNINIYQAGVQHKRFVEGVEIGGRLYKNDVAFKTDTIYLLRSVKFRPMRYRFVRDKFEDTIVAFRVVRKDADGSVVLIWRKM